MSEAVPDLAVVFAGRFQPFHRGHFAAWRWLCARFGEQAVWLASSDRTGVGDGYNRPAPFSFAEKHQIATRLFSVPEDRLVCIKSPYRPVEILGALPPERTAFVAAVGARDADRLRSRYWVDDPGQGPRRSYRDQGYRLILPAFADDLSASAIRAAFSDPSADPEAAFRALYPLFDPEIFALFVSRLGPGSPP